MEKEKNEIFLEYIEKAFNEVVGQMLDFDFKKLETEVDLGNNIVSCIVGLVGKERGRIVFKASEDMAKIVAEKVNCESIKDLMEMYLCVAEFTNIFGGRAVTFINNEYSGTDLRLTPPAIFVGTDMEIYSPNANPYIISFGSQHGPISLEVVFKGVL